MTTSKTFGQNDYVKTPHEPDGFTLVELLLVITLIGLVTATIVPQMGTSLRSWQLRGAAFQVAGALEASKLQAEQRQALVRFVLDPKDKSYWSERLEPSPETNSSLLLPRQRLPAELEFANLEGFMVQDQKYYLVFTPLGRSQASSMLVRTVKNNSKKAIQVATNEDGTVQIITTGS